MIACSPKRIAGRFFAGAQVFRSNSRISPAQIVPLARSGRIAAKKRRSRRMEGGLGLVGRSYTGVRSQRILFLSPRRWQPVRSPYNFKAARIVTLWRPAVVDFDQAYANAVVQSREQRGVGARRQCHLYGRLESVARRETRRGAVRSLGCVILPVVIGHKQRSIAVAKLQRWIGQRVRDTKGNQAWSNAADYDSVVTRAVPQREARNHYVATCADKGPRAEIGQLRVH